MGHLLGYSTQQGFEDVSQPEDDRPRDPRREFVRPHVLIVTDDEDLRDFLQEGLLFGGFWISIIASGVQALEVFRLRSFDLVLIDHALSGLNATELVRRLRLPAGADPTGDSRTDVPILMILDHPGAEAEHALNAGADAVLTPPIELETLVPYLHQVVDDWRRAHPGRPWADQVAQLRPK